MKSTTLLEEEVLHYLNEEWNNSIRLYGEGKLLTTYAFKLELENRGVFVNWKTLNLRLKELLKKDKVEKYLTSNGECWKPMEDNFSI